MSAAVPGRVLDILADDTDHRRRHEATDLQTYIGPSLANMPPDDGAPHPADTPEAERSAELVAAVNPYAVARVDLDALIDRGPPPADWLIEPVIAAGRSHALVAPPKAGKSLLTLAVVGSACVGTHPLNGRPMTPLRVGYVDHEMTPDDLYERLDDLGFTSAEQRELLAKNLLYVQLPASEPLDTATGAAQLVAWAIDEHLDLVLDEAVGIGRRGRGEGDRDDDHGEPGTRVPSVPSAVRFRRRGRLRGRGRRRRRRPGLGERCATALAEARVVIVGASTRAADPGHLPLHGP